MLMTVLTFTGCAAEQAPVAYDEAAVVEVCDFLIDYCASIDEATKEEWNSMTELAVDQQLLNAGLPLEQEAFLAAMNSWTAGVDECGMLIEKGEYVIEADVDSLYVVSESVFENREAAIEFVFDENLYLESLTISAHFSMGEILQKAGLNTLLGMGTVFAVLIFIAFIISLFKYIPAIQAAFSKKSKKEDANVSETPALASVVESVDVTDDLELVAVIAAAIAAYEGTTTDDFVVRSIKRRKSNKW
ncbi:MAG: OadG family protein [Oscillospiraceae bacterium]|nr:OadG family protein [Oscillospiraceae bacterium]